MQAAFNTGTMPTLPSVNTGLSADGQAKLATFIQAEKKHMQYHTQKPIPQGVH